MGEAFAAAQGPTPGIPIGALPKGVSSWPIMMFLGFIFTAPYLIMKLIGSVSSAAVEECKLNRIFIYLMTIKNLFPNQLGIPRPG